jgi:hypothetical protein
LHEYKEKIIGTEIEIKNPNLILFSETEGFIQGNFVVLSQHTIDVMAKFPYFDKDDNSWSFGGIKIEPSEKT